MNCDSLAGMKQVLLTNSHTGMFLPRPFTYYPANDMSSVANRGSSIRIPRECAAKGYGYFEDRRPASNADPYRITKVLLQYAMS